MKKKNLFLSYCWNDSNEAKNIYDYFKSSRNIELHKDTIDIGKWGSIKEYMQSISDMDYTILLISDSYLKSANCMYEVLEVMRDINYRDKIFPAVIYSGIYDPIIRIDYVKYWEDEFIRLKEKLDGLSVQNLGRLPEDLKRRQDISSNVAEFLGVVSDMNNPNIDDVCVLIEEKLSRQGFLGNNQIRDENDLMEDSGHIKENMNGLEGGRGRNSAEIPMRNRADEYAQRWNKNVFLNNFNKRDRNAGVNIMLQEIYPEKHLPHYKWKLDDEEFTDLKELLREYIVDNDDKKMLLILGQAGIGKSTLITWIMANLVEEKENILVYQFASDLRSVNWQDDNILDEIFSTIGLGVNELENKTLILDGFDEIHTDSDRERILNQIYHSLKEMNYLNRMSLIITCRKNYIDELQKVRCDHITLQTWDDEQIISFCKIYWSMSKRNILQNTLDKMLENKSVFGIPLILYMVLALNISIESNASLVDIYDKIFAVDGSGIYDRCINDMSYGKEHRISEVKQQIHQVSQRIAFWIFENNSAKAVIPRIEFRKICDSVMKEAKEKTEDIQSDVLIGSYFEPIRHCEGIGTGELQFVHRSIYEYFLSIYFFQSMRNLKSKEKIAGELGVLLKYGYLSEQVLKFIKYKFDSIKNYDLAWITRETFQMMLRDGMTFHIGIPYKHAVECELNIFANMLKVVHLWNCKLGKVDDRIVLYLQCRNLYSLNLEGIMLDGAKLDRVDLCGANLKEANLRGADLSGADLSEANLVRADLRGADLSRVNLFETCLFGADLRGADLRRAELLMTQLRGANLNEVDLRGADLRRASLFMTQLRGANLSEAQLSGADLRGVDLSETDLSGANLIGADLSGADLFKADLSGTDLSGANLSETIFNEEQVDILHKKYDLSRIKVELPEINKIISYKEYCIRK